MTIAHPRPAATLILVRPASLEPEILLLKRSAEAKFMPNAFVFAGGAVDQQDEAAEMHPWCSPPDDAQASSLMGLASGGRRYLIAAVREAFEECGLLLAYDCSGELADLSGWDPLALRKLRENLAAGADTLNAICAAHRWQLALDRLAYFAHWVTPATMPRRFDTRFFVAQAPPKQAASLAEREMSELCWRTAAKALKDAADGKILLVTATKAILKEIAQFQSIEALLVYAQGPRTIQTVRP
jgi:8-oxo-dGTP pyrophosphatase MutT (NUDIX family)